MACPTSARSRSYTADPTHAFKVTAHWAGSSWLSAWMGPFADHYQECMYHNFSKLHPRRKAAERRNMMPDVHDAMTTSSVETVYTCTEIGPGKPQVQGSAANGGAIAQGARTPRTSRSPSCLRVKGSPARTLRGKAGKSGATAGRLATVQHAAGYGSPAPSTPTKNKAAAMSKKGAGKQATAFEQRPSGAPVSAQTWVPPAPMHAVCDSLRPSTPRRSRITDADLVMDAKLLVGSAASAPTATPSKVPLLPIGMSPAGVAPGNSMFALSPRVLEQNLTDQVGDGLQMAAAVSTAQTWQSNDLLAGQNQEEATLFRKRALDAACQGQQLSDTNLAGGSWDLGDLGDVAGDWAPTRGVQTQFWFRFLSACCLRCLLSQTTQISVFLLHRTLSSMVSTPLPHAGSMKICFDQVQESQKAQQEMECAAMQLLSLKCGHN